MSTLTGENLAARALLEWSAAQAASAARQKETEAGDLMRIWEKLESFGVTPDKTRTIRNRHTSEVLVPISDAVDTRASSDDPAGPGIEGFYQPAVAATARHGEVWIVAEHAEEPKPGHYLPVAPLTGLHAIGQALTEGGHSPWLPPTVDDQINRALTSVSGDYTTGDGDAYLAGAQAICASLLDIAAAIREGGNV